MNRLFLRGRCLAAAVSAVSLTLAALVPAQSGQFAPPAPAPFDLDNVQGEWINFETQLIKPIHFTLKEMVVVANEPNGTLDVFDLDLNFKTSIVLGHGICSIAERETFSGGTEIWVSVRHQQAIAVIEPKSWEVSHWLRPTIQAAAVGYGDADHPGQVVFGPKNKRAYVTCFHTDKVAVFDTTTKAHINTISLGLPHNGVISELNTPYSMVLAKDHLFVVSHLSGNQSMAEPNAVWNGQRPPDGFAIRDLNADPNRSLPDFDIVVIDTGSDTVVSHKKEVGTVNFNIAYHEKEGVLVVSNLHLRNSEFIGEGSWPQGRVGLNRLTFIDPFGAPTGPHNVVLTESLGSATNHIAQPTDIAVDHQGRVIVAGYGSSKVGFFDAGGSHLGTLSTESGPRGLAVGHERLYVLSRGTNTVQWYDISTAVIPSSPNGQVALVDPTPENVKEGRQIFISSDHSGNLSTSCQTCHIDGRKAGLGWDLSGYHDNGNSFTLTNEPNFWKDRKGVMVTQDLRGLPGTTPFHWRGEQHDLEFFNGAFEELLHGAPLGRKDFARFKAFVFSMVYPPNGQQQVNREFTADATTALTGDNCFACHALPLGTNNDLTIPITGGFNQLVPLTAQLRGLNFKESSLTNINNAGVPSTNNMTGFGLLHNGRNPTSDEFINFFFGGLPTRKAMLNEFDTGAAPSAVYSEMLNSTTAGTVQMNYMVDQARRLFCDLAGRGRMWNGSGWQRVGMLYDPATNLFRFDDSGLAPITPANAVALAAGGRLHAVMLCVPHWSGERVGLDRDRDGIHDMDELNAGLDPDNPDTDGDGQWESYDLNPLLPSAPPGGTVDAFNIQVVYVTTNTVKVTWETKSFSPTRLVYGLTTSYGSSAGDPFPINLSPNTSKLWKRKHTAFLRILRDGALYNFAIVTQAQNGMIWQSKNQRVLVSADNISPNLRVDAVTLTQVGAPPFLNWVATVRVVDNAGIPVPGVNVRGLFNHFVGGNAVAESNVGPSATNGAGIATLSVGFVGQASGDKTRFTLPQLIDVGGGTLQRPVSGQFMWPESAPRGAEVIIP